MTHPLRRITRRRRGRAVLRTSSARRSTAFARSAAASRAIRSSPASSTRHTPVQSRDQLLELTGEVRPQQRSLLDHHQSRRGGRHGRPASIRRLASATAVTSILLCPSRKGFGEGRAWVAEGSEKQGRPVYAIQTASRANSGRRTAECNVDYISPARLAPRHRDVASASRGRGLSVFARSDCSATYSCLLWSVMTIHLVNPSHLVLRRWRHHAAVAVRAGRGHTGHIRTATYRRRDARAARFRHRPGRRHRGDRDPHRQRAARL